MKVKKVLRYDEAMTLKARELFGSEIVDSAFVVSAEEAGGRLRRVNIQYDRNTILFHGEEIWIKFSNGNTVAFWNSEWGGMARTDPKVADYYKAINNKGEYPWNIHCQ